MVYYNYFIPVHSDGRTAAESLGLRPPNWLSPLVAAHRVKELPFSEAKLVEEDSSHFQGVLASSIAQDIMERGGTSERARVVMQIMEELGKDSRKSDDLKELQAGAFRRRSRVEAERGHAGGDDEPIFGDEGGEEQQQHDRPEVQ